MSSSKGDARMTKLGDSIQGWVVAHCGARDDYQLPLAHHEVGRLHRFVTDWYSPLDRTTIRLLMRNAPNRMGEILERRYRKELPSHFVKDVKVKCMLNSFIGSNTSDMRLNRMIGECAAEEAVASDSNLLITSYYGWAAFPGLPKHKRKVLFQIHPHPRFLQELFLERFKKCNDRSYFDSETELKVSDDLLRRWGQESFDADLVIAASSFTRRSLVSVGVNPANIHVIPYGVDGTVFRNDVAMPSGKTKILFVGQATSRKGFSDLLRTWKRLGDTRAELHIVSATATAGHQQNSDGSVVWHGRLALGDLVALMNSVDLLVLPSIAEGFGHVLLQSLSCGTPILCSDATAGPDLLSGWEEGFVFASGDWDALAARLDHWVTNSDHLRRLRRSARQIAEGLTWDRFRRSIRVACDAATSV